MFSSDKSLNKVEFLQKELFVFYIIIMIPHMSLSLKFQEKYNEC